MLLKHYFVEKIAHSSYLLAGNNSCAVIDPKRDADIYIEEARKLGVRITHIIETHLHADFISGHIDLADKTGAKIYAPASAKCTFDHEPVSEGDKIMIEDMELDVIETPGHTPEHVSYIIKDLSRADEPVGIFTGDTLFVGDVGRPDLFPDIAQELAGKLYHSLHDKILKLPDYCEVYPAHGAGSLCGRAMGAKWRSTIGFERKFNEALLIKDKDEFIKSLTSDMPPAPDHFSLCSDINRKGPVMIKDLPELEELKPSEFLKKITNEGYIVLDTRSYDCFTSQHIEGSWHIDIGGNFPTFAGWVIPPKSKVLLVSANRKQAQTAARRARRTGIDHIAGFLDGSMFAWAVAGQKTASVGHMSTEDLYQKTTASSQFSLIDVRAPKEFEDNHIEGAVNI
ncbi:MAG: MBL fold metallo-hydrolase, partial [Candidatus Delongbacteria bacterium]